MSEPTTPGSKDENAAPSAPTETLGVGRAYLFVAFLAFSCLVFLAGMLAHRMRLFPYRPFNQAFAAARTLKWRYVDVTDPADSMLWAPIDHEKKGVTVNVAGRAMEGWTLYSSGHAQGALLIDMAGKVVHQWDLQFADAWADGDHIKSPARSEWIFYRRCHVFPNGDLLAIMIAESETPWGYGLLRMNKDSEPIWRFSDRVHHDFSIGKDGRIYTLTHLIQREPMPGIPEVTPPLTDDYIVVVSPEGEELARVHILGAFRDSDFAPSLHFIGNSNALHTNAIEVVTDEVARSHPYVKEGQVIISMRNTSALAAIDLDAKKVTWVSRGPWAFQHDPDFLPEGRMLLFDNLGDPGPGLRSRVLEFDPQTMEIFWSYSGDADNPLYSKFRSRQQRLGNGNTLITECDRGRILEVTPEGDLVWEYHNPERGGDGDGYIANITDGQRLTRDELPFLFEE